MLKHLRIQNIILIEQAEISFSSGLNVLTGETGSGKSAILDSLNLAIGERTDTDLIRRGCDKGIVEAAFDVDGNPSLLAFLSEFGIEHEAGQDLIIRREILASGKGRIFINHQQAQLSLLRQLGAHLVQMVNQHANQWLFSLDQHRHLLDLYSDLMEDGADYQKSFHLEQTLRQQLNDLVQQESQRLREIDVCHRELQELNEAHLQEGEEEELFSEYTLLVNAKELASKLLEVNQALSGERQAIISNLNRQKMTLDSISHLDPALSEIAQILQNALLELQEASHTLRQYQGRLHDDPERLDWVSQRLSLLNKLKRKYGTTLPEIKVYHEQAQARLAQLQQADVHIEELQARLKEAEEETHQLAAILTSKRQSAAEELGKALTSQLVSLNMSKAQFIVSVTPQKRTSQGQDKVEFFLVPNVGEHQVALREGASGGELSRVLIAFQRLLAGKGKTPTLVFDEVDANIGGETATIIGEKLKDISQQHQVICITHFPQVARQAHHHLQISKQEKEGRTVALVRTLDSQSRQQELIRMLGGKTLAEHSESQAIQTVEATL